MGLYCIKRLVFEKNENFKIRQEINGNINLYSGSIDCGFKKFGTIDE